MSEPITAQAAPPVFGLGDRGRAVSEIRSRLALLGLSDDGDSNRHLDPETFDERLDQAVLAFQQQRGLAADGIVDRFPNRGVFIASPGAEDIRNLYRARAVVEPGALLWGDALDVDALDRIVTDAEVSVSESSSAETALANQLFHRTVVESAGSTLLNEEMDRLLARMRLVFLTVGRNRPGFHDEFVPVNRQVVTLLRAGDRAGAASTLRASLVETGEALACSI